MLARSMKQQAISLGLIKGSGLVIPDDFVLPDLDYIRSRLVSKSGKSKLDETVYLFAKFVYKDSGVADAIPAGFNKDLSDSIIITCAAYLAEALP